MLLSSSNHFQAETRRWIRLAEESFRCGDTERALDSFEQLASLFERFGYLDSAVVIRRYMLALAPERDSPHTRLRELLCLTGRGVEAESLRSHQIGTAEQPG